MSGDILDAIDQAVAEHESCPCGREIPADCASWFWCTEACQIAWNLHQYDPVAHPHPRDIRERQEQIIAEGHAARTARAQAAPGPVSAPYARRQDHIHTATPVSGMLGAAPADAETTAICTYTRWCPQCQAKTLPAINETGTHLVPAGPGLLDIRPTEQMCSRCDYAWPGRPLVGTVEKFDAPGFRRNDLIRLRLTDGFRSATRLIPRRNLELWRSPETCLALEWEHLEEQLCDGVTDRRRQESNERIRRTRGLNWDWRAIALLGRPENIIRPGGGV